MMHEQVCCHDEAASHDEVAHSCSLLNHPNSFCGGMFKLNIKFDAHSNCSVILIVMATQYSCSFNGAYCSH